MAEPISLNKARKARQRERDKAQAAENRVKFGRTKAEKQAEKAAKESAAKTLSLHRRELNKDATD